MDTMIYNPLEEYRKKFKDLHLKNTKAFFEKTYNWNNDPYGFDDAEGSDIPF